MSAHLAREVVARPEYVEVGLWVPRAVPPGLVERAIDAAWPGARAVEQPGDPFTGTAPTDAAIENRTDAAIVVYFRDPDGSEHPTELIPTIPPQARVETELDCGAGALIARTEEGSLVAKRGPFPECNLEDWIIAP